jgi:hypothetical protein
MSQSPGTPGAPTLVLRLSVPAGHGFRAVAVDLALKVAEYVGCPPPDAPKVAAILDSLAATVAQHGDQSTDIAFEFHQLEDELRIEARCAGRSVEARHPLPGAAT